MPRGDGQPRDGSRARQGFAAKAQGRDRFQIARRGDLARRVAGQGETQIVRVDAVAVVGHAHPAHAGLLHLHADVPGAGVQAVLHQLLDDGGGPLHHLAGRDLVCHERAERTDAAGRAFRGGRHCAVADKVNCPLREMG